MDSRYYSPYPFEHYCLAGDKSDPLAVIAETGFKVEVWNWVWLSWPTIDDHPDQSRLEIRCVLPCLISDVLEDPTLLRNLRRSPGRFADWFQDEDASIYDTYIQLGGEAWRNPVLARARAAQARLGAWKTGAIWTGNVAAYDFRRGA